MSLLANQFFLQIAVPLLTVGLTVFMKIVSRTDRSMKPQREDLAVGYDIAATALILFITGSADLARQLVLLPPQMVFAASEKLSAVPWIVAAFLLGMWGLSTLIKLLGWERKGKPKVLWGIVIPDVFGLLLLFFAVNWIRS